MSDKGYHTMQCAEKEASKGGLGLSAGPLGHTAWPPPPTSTADERRLTHDPRRPPASSAGNTRKYPGKPRYFRVFPGFFAVFCLLAAEQQ